MSDEDDSRPDPEALLAEVQKESRGRLKIFLGAAPGVGKTFAMLRAARAARRDGVDVVAGVVESHGRRETERLLVGLEVLPRRILHYRGRPFPEMDLDALLARNPQLALVDELAHTNVAGSRHAKRWQDVEELLAAGIDVHTTLNVQHLESFNDIVERISGIKVRETVPDRMLERADDIELIDLTPEELQKRLREGKVYVPEQAERAITRFFSRGNLMALRELALRAAAERVDRDMLDFMRGHAAGASWPTRDRLLVCIGGGSDAERLVRTGKRMADRARCPWIVLHITEGNRPEEVADRALRLADELGAETETVSAAGSPAAIILDVARQRNVTRIVVGRSSRRSPFARPLHEALIGSGGTFEITVVGVEGPATPPPMRRQQLDNSPAWRPYAAGALFVALALPVAYLVDATLPLANLSLVFLAAVLASAAQGHVWAAVTTSLTAFITYNFFFTEPRLTFHVVRGDEVLTLVFFLAFSLVVGVLGARLRHQVEAIRVSESQTRALYEFTRKALSATTDYDIAWTVVAQLHSSLGSDTVLLLPDRTGELTVVAGAPPIDEVDAGSFAAADWAWRQGSEAGWSTNTLPTSRWLFLPLRARERTLGVLGVAAAESRAPLTPRERRLIDVFADQAALILERARMIAETAEAQRFSQTEKLRTALLSSISHDLRTPLVSIIGAISSLRELGDRIGEEGRRDLLDTVAAEAARLNRFIQNMLDMTRLGYGAVRVRQEWLDLPDVVATARERLAARLAGIAVETQIAPEASAAFADPTLLEQVLVNLIDNAARYTPPGAPVEVTAGRERSDLVITVADRGPGVPPDKRDRIFDMFFRSETGDRQGAGTGLGLAIVSGFVEAMGGTVRVHERDGGGAAFRVVLPQPALPEMEADDE